MCYHGSQKSEHQLLYITRFLKKSKNLSLNDLLENCWFFADYFHENSGFQTKREDLEVL
jgi:hypothetical protein